jgi:5'-methylthioadenosine phosphorylase
MIIANLTENARMAQQVIAGAVGALPFERTCECATAMKYAIITRPDAVPVDLKRELAPIVGKYLQ